MYKPIGNDDKSKAVVSSAPPPLPHRPAQLSKFFNLNYTHTFRTSFLVSSPAGSTTLDVSPIGIV